MADIRHQPGGSKKMNATYKTKRATLTGSSLCQFMKKLLLLQCCMKSAFAIANEE